MVGVALVLLLFAAPGLITLVVGANHLLVAILIHSAERDEVSDAVTGDRVDLEGDVRPHERTLEGPVSGRECLGYEYSVEKYSPRGKGTNWDTVDSGGTTVPFLLDTDTGTVLVSAEDPNLAFNDDEQRVILDPDEDRPAPIRRFVERNEDVDPTGGRSIDLKVTEVHTGKRRRYTEYTLVPGETAYVAGAGTSPADARTSVPREASAVVGAPGGTGGIRGRLERTFSPRWFVVADYSMRRSRNRNLLRGVGFVLFGVIFAGIPLYVLLETVG